MDVLSIVVVSLLTSIVVYQQFFWSKITRELIDKLMSRSYHEYKTAQNLDNPVPRIKVDDGIQEDLGHLSELLR